MDLALTEEQEFLREAARGALSRVRTVEAAREALEGGELPDLWPTACEAGWPGLLIAEDHEGAGLGPMDAMLVFEELGPRARRRAAARPPAGHAACSTAAGADAGLLAELAAGARARGVRARPAADRPRRRAGPSSRTRDRPGCRPRGPKAAAGSAARCTGSRTRRAPTSSSSRPRTAGRRSWTRAPTACRSSRCTATTPRARSVTCDWTARPATRSRAPTPDSVAAAWYLASALLAAESLGAVERALEVSVRYAKERFTFGRAIGSYQAVKHQLVEILRRLDNARSLMFYAGWAGADKPDGVARSPRRRSGCRRARRSRRRRARRSPCTAASGRPGSTTRRCTSARRSCRGGCSAGRPAPLTAWPASCSHAERGPPPERLDARPVGGSRSRSSHKFPIRKYALLRERVIADGLCAPDEVHEAEPVPWAALGRVQDAALLGRIRGGELRRARAARARPAVVAGARRARPALDARDAAGRARGAARRRRDEPRRRHAPRRTRLRTRLLPVQRRRAGTVRAAA